MKLTTFLATGLAILTLTTPLSVQTNSIDATPTIAASSIEYQTMFDVDKITLYNDKEQRDLISVTDGKGNLLFSAIPTSDTVYTTAPLNVRDIPCILKTPVGTLQTNSKVKRVGVGMAGWDIIQINEINYFVWSDYLTTNIPNSEDIVEVHEVKPNQPDVYSTVAAKKSSGTIKNIDKQEPISNKGTYLGNYKLTAYCSCSKCCGKWAGGNTASGAQPTVGRTVACNSLPFGTKININGHIYTVEDTGNMTDNVIDIYFDSHSSALEFGVQYANVYRAS